MRKLQIRKKAGAVALAVTMMMSAAGIMAYASEAENAAESARQVVEASEDSGASETAAAAADASEKSGSSEGTAADASGEAGEKGETKASAETSGSSAAEGQTGDSDTGNGNSEEGSSARAGDPGDAAEDAGKNNTGMITETGSEDKTDTPMSAAGAEEKEGRQLQDSEDSQQRGKVSGNSGYEEGKDPIQGAESQNQDPNESAESQNQDPNQGAESQNQDTVQRKEEQGQDTESEKGSAQKAEEGAEQNPDSERREERPALSAEKTADNGVKVSVNADEGIFPEGTSTVITSVSREQTMETAQALYPDRQVVDAAAVDITFFDIDGREIQPADSGKVHVVLTAPNRLDGDSQEVVHIRDGGEALEVADSDISRVTERMASFEADSFSVYAIIGLDGSRENRGLFTRTYRFYDSQGDEIPDSSQTVKKGDTLLEPSVPAEEDGQTFLGWVTEDGDRFEGFGRIGEIAADGETVTLTAWYGDAVYIYYHDRDNTLVRTEAAVPNSTIRVYGDTPAVRLVSNKECQDGWALTQNGTEDVSGDFQIGTESVDLYPIIKTGYWVSFDTGSSYSIARQFIPYNAEGDAKKAKKPETDPVKQGYAFDRWYSDAGLTQEYDFNSAVSGNMVLYAGYTPDTDTEYTVNYWIEYQKADDGETHLGKDEGWDYRLLKTEKKTGTTGENTQYDADYIFQGTDRRDSAGYELNVSRSETKTIAPDGSTEINVYYDCKKYSITIHYSSTYADESEKDVKYSASLLFLWDRVFKKVPESQLFRDGIQWECRNITYAGTLSQISSKEAADEYWYWYDRGRFNKHIRYYYEALEGAASSGQELVRNTSARVQAGTVSDNRLYYLAGVDSFNAYTWGCTLFPRDYDSIRGFHWAAFYGDGNIDYTEMRGVRYIGAWFHRAAGGYGLSSSGPGAGWEENLYEYSEDKDGYLDLYFWRNRYSLIFQENGGPELEDYTGDGGIPYQKSLSGYEPSSYVIGVTRKTEGNQEFVFDGWYEDADFSEVFDFSRTMPADSLTLYAKWKSMTYTVSFDTGSGSKVAPVENVAYGSTIAKPEDPVYEDHYFLGWTLNGRIFSFASGITADTTLTADWRSVSSFKVTYDLNGGSGTVPEDSGEYYENAGVTAASAASVVPPSGKVFLGWKSSGDGRIYYPNSSVPMAFGGLTLTAQWGDIDKTTSLTYDFSFGKYGVRAGGPSAVTVYAMKNNSRLDLQDITSLREDIEGYVFKGWYLDEGGTDGPYTRVQVDSSGTGNRVYAKWSRIYTITYTDGTGGSLFGDEIHEAESGAGTPSFSGGMPSRSGYTFTGWSPAVTDTVTKDMVYTAQWEKKGQNTETESGKKEETETESGSETETETEVGPETESRSKRNKETEAEEKSSAAAAPKTGDDSQTGGYAVLLLAAASAAAFLSSARRRQKRGK